MHDSIHDDGKTEFIEVRLDDEESDGGSLKPPSEPCQDMEKSDKVTQSKSNKVLHELLSYVVVVLSALVLALAINRFILLNAHVPSTSMVPTIDKNDRFIGLRLSYLFSDPQRGDIVVFDHRCYKGEDKMILVKRIIGLPGDVVTISGGKVSINGVPLDEDYLNGYMEGSFGPYTVPDDSYFLMGDNRNVSDDGRYWDYPYVTRDEIIAKAWFRYKPEFNVIK